MKFLTRDVKCFFVHTPKINAQDLRKNYLKAFTKQTLLKQQHYYIFV
jgi:hypothetical protein